MTNPTDPRPPRPPPPSPSRTWWFGGEFWGVRFRAALGIRTLEPAPTIPDTHLLGAVSPAQVAPGPGRAQLEVWEAEGGAVVEEAGWGRSTRSPRPAADSSRGR